jgi:hypothetical protein
MTAVLQQEVRQKAAPKKSVRELKRLHTAGCNRATSVSGCYDCFDCFGCSYCFDCVVLPPDP